MAEPLGCDCVCHDWLWANNRALHHKGNYMSAHFWAQRSKFRNEVLPYVDDCDPVEAALARKLCIDRHCGALAGPPPPLRPQPPREQADGWTDPPPPEGSQ